MEQLNIFGGALPPVVLPSDLMEYHTHVFDAKESIELMETLINTVPWEQKTVIMYGKPIVTPRLMAWYGDTGKDYSFSGTKYDPIPWTNELLKIKTVTERLAGITFNSVLLNYYRNGNDSVAWHSDDEYELGIKPVIASVSLGEARRFDVRHKTDHQNKYSIELENGSLLLMKGDMQHNWEHRIAKSARSLRERVNLTFRVINK